MNSPRSTLGPRLLAGFGLAALLGGLGLASSRPARTAGGPVPVAVANMVQSADSPTRQPFQAHVNLGFQGGHGEALLTQVPGGKRLVIESLTATDNRSSDDNAYSIAVSGFSGKAGVSLTPTGDPFPIKTLPVRLTAEAGEKVTVAVDSSQAGLIAAVSVYASGYFVDVP